MRLLLRVILLSIIIFGIVIILLMSNSKPNEDSNLINQLEIINYEKKLLSKINQEITENLNTSLDFIRHTMHMLDKSPKLCDIKYQYSIPRCTVFSERNLIPSMTYKQLIEYAVDNLINFGGYWVQKNCYSDQTIAIIIPFRDRWVQVMQLLPVLHQILQIQNNCYRIFLVEQLGSESFNKGRLNNAGFLESISMFYFNCVIFHDTDLIPETSKIPYKCNDTRPIHLASAVDVNNYRLPYSTLIGGVIAFKPFHYVLINGYSNYYWGWGLEDDDLEMRLKETLSYNRVPESIGRYRTIKHKRQYIFPIQKSRRKVLLNTATQRMSVDGLSNLNYKVVKKSNNLLFTHIIVDIGNQPNEFF